MDTILNLAIWVGVLIAIVGIILGSLLLKDGLAKYYHNKSISNNDKFAQSKDVEFEFKNISDQLVYVEYFAQGTVFVKKRGGMVNIPNSNENKNRNSKSEEKIYSIEKQNSRPLEFAWCL